MILDNAETERTVGRWITDWTGEGQIDAVTGYFTVGALAYLSEQLSDRISRFRFVNRAFHGHPVAVLFRYRDGNGHVFASLASCERTPYTQAWREGEKPGRVSLLRDIDLGAPHAGHLRILNDLRIERTGRKAIRTFRALQEQWRRVLNVEVLTKAFYRRIADWFSWATKTARFPEIPGMDVETRHKTAMIRLITRIVFCWFAREKGLLDPRLFNADEADRLLNAFDANSMTDGSYYKGILQNLFFPTLSVPVGKRRFIRRSFQGKNDDYLEPYVYRHSELFRDPASFECLFSRVPFLNGGLFELLDHKQTQPDGSRREIRVDGFSTRPRKQPLVPNILFFGSDVSVDLTRERGDKRATDVSVDGLFHILDAYKFTLAENTPFDQDIALDPELLGRIFENLLAEYNEDTRDTARRDTGSFYTPRTIVSYIVDGTLRTYLAGVLGDAPEATDRIDALLGYGGVPDFSDAERVGLLDAVYDVSILDPACGSGAFPMGALQKLVHVLDRLDTGHEHWKQRILADTPAEMRQETRRLLERGSVEHNWKLGIIQRCIYGVDMQPIAVQIAKLRCFIALLVDFDVDASAEDFGVPALPNLDFKFVAADTLIGPPGGRHATGNLLGLEDSFFADFARLGEDYFFVRDPKRKAGIRADIEKLVNGKIRERERALAGQRGDGEDRMEIREALASKNEAVIAATEREIALWESYRNILVTRNAPVRFFATEYFYPQVNNGFDIVIGNPPYRSLEKFSPEEKQRFKDQGYTTQAARGDVYCLFYERGARLLREGGVLGYITSNKWMRANYGKGLRAFFSKDVDAQRVLDFGMAQNFGAGTTYTCVVTLINRPCESPVQCCYAADDRAAMADPEAYFTANSVQRDGLSDAPWVVLSRERTRIKELGEARGVRLKRWDLSISYGIKTGLNEAFFITGEQRAQLIDEDPSAAELIAPLLRGRDVQRYGIDFADRYVLLVKNGAHRTLEQSYPSVHTHLKQYEPKLKRRGQCQYSRSGTGNTNQDYPGQHHWLELDNNPTDGYLAEFRKPKIIYPIMTKYLGFFLDDGHGYFLNDKAFFVRCEHAIQLAFLTAVLNSSLFRSCFRDNFPDLMGNTYELRKVIMSEIPLLRPDNEAAELFEPLVALVQAARAAEIAKETSRSVPPAVVAAFLEEVIDACVLQTYFPDHFGEKRLQVVEHVHPLLTPQEGADRRQRLATAEAFYRQANAADHPVRNRLMRIPIDSPDFLRVIKEEGKV